MYLIEGVVGYLYLLDDVTFIGLVCLLSVCVVIYEIPLDLAVAALYYIMISDFLFPSFHS